MPFEARRKECEVIMFKENYHTHMRLCRHAQGDIKDYVEEAIRLGFHSLGISDHGPISNPGFKRMTIDEFYKIYVPEFMECKKRYQNQIKLFLGLEIEYIYGNDSYYKEVLKSLDYLILGCHYYSGYKQMDDTSSFLCNTKERLEEYVKLIEDALATKCFKILAHPDIFLGGYPRWDEYTASATRRIVLACIKNNVYLECNCNGFSKNQKDFGGIKDYMYPNKEFFKIVSEYEDIKVIVSSDAHNPSDLDKNLDKGYQMLNELNIHPIENPLEVKND